MSEREILAEALRGMATIRSGVKVWAGVGWWAEADYLGVRLAKLGDTVEEATAAALLALADKLLKVRDHVGLLLAPDIDPTKRQSLPTVKL